jgi:replicative DNA helicase
VLGAVLLDPEAVHRAVEFVKDGDFFRDAHRRIFRKMLDLMEHGQAIDFITVKDELARSGELDRVGGPAYIASLVDGLPHGLNVGEYARIVKEKSTLRSLINSAGRILETAYRAEDDAAQIIDEAEREIFAIAEGSIHGGFMSMRELAGMSFAIVEKAHERRELVTGVPTGFKELDEMLAGLQPSDLIIVAARPSMGKTSLVLNIAQHVGTQTEKTVGFFSLEMSKEQLFLRMLTSEASIDSHRLRTGFLGERDFPKLTHALEVLGRARIYIDDTASIGVLEMRAKARRLKAEHGLDLIVIDYIQLMQGRGRFENRVTELASVSRGLKGLAKELNVPVVVLSQLSRAPEARPGRRPQLSDLRESGALEQDADVVVMIYREDMYEATEENQGVAELIIAKQRNGPTGSVKLAFIREFTRFANLEGGHPS